MASVYVNLPVISVTSSPPVGASTEAKQDLGNASLASIDAKTPALGQQLAAASQPVVLTAVQLATLTPPAAISGYALEVTQSAGNTLIGAVNETASASDTANSGLNGRLQRIAQNLTAVIAKLPVIGPQLKSASQSITFASDMNFASIVNSSVTPLGSNAVFTGTSENVSQYSEVRIIAFSDVAGSLSIQQSQDGTNWDVLDVYALAAGTALNVGIGISSIFYRAVYTNGVAAQTVFRMQSVFHAMRTKPSSHRSIDARTNENDLEEVMAYSGAFNGTTWDRARSGITGAISSILGYANVLPVLKYVTTPPALTNGQWHELQGDANGSLKTVVTDDVVISTITTQNLVPAGPGAPTAGSTATILLNGAGTVTIQTVGTYTGALTVQGTTNGVNWITLNAIVNVSTGTNAGNITTALQGMFQVDVAGFSAMRVSAGAAVTGSVVVTLRASRGSGLTILSAPLPPGSSAIGSVTEATVAGTVTSAQIAVGTTAVRLTASGAAPAAARKKLQFQASPANTGRVWYGPSTVTISTGVEIIGPDKETFNFDSGDYYVISDTAAQVVSIVEKA